jgi:hypothetical protein
MRRHKHTKKEYDICYSFQKRQIIRKNSIFDFSINMCIFSKEILSYILMIIIL